jgi:hypothetical protein
MRLRRTRERKRMKFTRTYIIEFWRKELECELTAAEEQGDGGGAEKPILDLVLIRNSKRFVSLEYFFFCLLE